MAREFRFYGKTEEELKSMDMKEFAKLVPSRARRTLIRSDKQSYKRLMEKVELARQGKYKKTIKTHNREAIIVPSMLGMAIHVYNGKSFIPVVIVPEMLGHCLGEYVLTRGRVAHSAPGIGATRSSAAEKK